MHPLIPLLQLVHTLKRIEGRKKLQKTVHILKELGAPFAESFEYSLYGMYSLTLKNEVSILAAEHLVSEESQPSYAGSTYVIQATSELENLVAEFHIPEPAWGSMARQLNEKSPQVLEGISTILFLRRTEGNERTLRDRLLSLKPHLASMAEECFAEAGRLSRIA